MPTTTGKATDLITFSRGTLATVTDADGKVKWAAHNLLLASEQCDASNWTKDNVTVSANNIVAPNGTTTADRIVETSATGVHGVKQNGPGAGTFTLGVFAKAGERSWVALNIANLANSIVYFDLANGVVGTKQSAVTAASITLIGSGWYYVTSTITLTSTGLDPNILIASADNTLSYAGNTANGIYIWGAHLYRADLGGMQANPSAYPYYNPSTPKNLLGQSEGFDTATWAKSAVTVSANAIAAPNGSLSADKIVENTANSAHLIGAATGITTVSGGVYTISVYAKAGERSFIAVYDGTTAKGKFFNLAAGTVGGNLVGAPLDASITAVGDGWYRCAIRITGGATCVPSVYLSTDGTTFSYTGDGVSGVYLWGAQLSDSASLDTYVPNFGAAPSAAAAHGPRLDYSSSGSALGLLVEETRTNLALNSAAVAGASYILRNTTIDANATEAPDGSSTATKLKETTGSNFFDAYQSTTVTSGAVYTASVYAKAAERNWIWMQPANGNNKTWFNLSTGVVGTNGAGNTATITSAGNGWYRCTVSCAAATTTGYVDVGVSNADNTITYTGVAGNGVYVWGAQFEAGSFATSYIPTAAATVTRNADVCSVGVSQFPYSSSEGTLVVAFSKLSTALRGGLLSLADVSTSTANAVHLDAQNDGKMRAFTEVGAANPFLDTDIGAYAANAVHKCAIAYKLDDVNAAANGVIAGADDTSAALPAAANNLQIGAVRNNSNAAVLPLNGHIRQITHLPRRLPNADLAARTA